MNIQAGFVNLKALTAFLETDISKREVMGKYARQKMVDEFDKKIIVNDTIKALDL